MKSVINLEIEVSYGIQQRIFRIYFSQLSDLNEITYRAMMGEFVIYYCGKIVGGIL